MKKIQKGIIGALAVLLLVGLAIAPAVAKPYAYDGYPLITVKNGTIWGDVYVSAGTNYGLPASSNAYQPNSLTTTYYLPPGDSIEWAKLCVGVWGGKDNYTGWANVTLDGELLGPNELLNKTTPGPGPHSTCIGKGVWGIEYYDIGNVISDKLGGSATCVVNAWNTSDADGVRFDCRIYGATLVMAYRNCSANATAYWINNGLENLNYVTPHYGNKTTFDGVLNLSECSSADEVKLTLGYYASDYGHPDFAYFNVPTGGAKSPANFGDIDWSLNAYSPKQIDGEDVADEMGDTTSYFDLKSFTATNKSSLKEQFKDDTNNYLIYRNGYDFDYSGTLECGYYDDPKEGESYYSPFLAVMTADTGCNYDFSEGAGTTHFAYESAYFNGNLSVIDSVDSATVNYTKIEAPDGEYHRTQAAMGYHAAQLFVFKVNKDCAEKLKLKWIGRGFDSSAGVTIYLWNFGTNQFDPIASTDTEDWTQVVKEIPVNGYMNNDGEIYVLIVQNGVTDYSSISTIDTDYIRLQLCSNLHTPPP